jgi:hypothetical protein
MFRCKISLLICIAVLFLVSAQSTPAQSGATVEPSAKEPNEARVLRVLLDEMRQLRLTLETFNLRQLRSTIVQERVRRQEGRIETLNSDLEKSRKQIRDLTTRGGYDDELEELKEVETAIKETNDECARAQLTQDYARLKHALERRKKADSEALERLRLLEPQLNTQLQTELDRLAELDSQLEGLERELDQQIAEAERARGVRK